MGREAFIRALMTVEQVYEKEIEFAKDNGLSSVLDVLTPRVEKVRSDRINAELSLQARLMG
jgi:effector-binding domain-containing protein